VKLVARYRRTVILLLLATSIVVYPVLLVPYIIHHNLPNVGMVLFSDRIGTDQLPQGIKTYLRPGSDLFFLIVRQVSPVRTDQPYTEWIMAVITQKTFERGKMVEFIDPLATLFVDWRDYPFKQSFNELIIADVVQELSGIEAYVESIIYGTNGGVLLTLSTADYYAGPVVFPLLALVFWRRLTFWSILLSVWGYAFGQQLYTHFSLIHHNVVPEELKLFGFTSFMWAAAAVLLWIYETKTTHGRRLSETVFSFRRR
jgi:hypothetical protein